MSVSLPIFLATMTQTQRFLTLQEVVHVLNCCPVMRRANAVAIAALERQRLCQHFFGQCPFDSFAVQPGVWVDDDDYYELGLACEADVPPGVDCSHGLWRPYSTPAPLPCEPVQLLSLVGLLEKFVLPWCFQPMLVCSEVHVVRPVIVPLISDSLPSWMSSWTQPSPPSSSHSQRSCFGLHWDNIHVDLEACRAECACCSAYEPTLQDYRRTVSLLYRRWLVTARSRVIPWRQRGLTSSQIQELVTRLRTEMLPEDGFFNEAMAAASDSELIDFICTHTDMSHTFRVDADEETSHWNWQSVFHPIMRSICQQFMVPFKAAALKCLAQVHRVVHQERDEHHEDKVNCSDIVAGVFPAGFLVGFFYLSQHFDPH